MKHHKRIGANRMMELSVKREKRLSTLRTKGPGVARGFAVFFLCLAGLAAIAWASRSVFKKAGSFSLFEIRRVQVMGNLNVSEAELLSALSLALPKSALELPKKNEIRRRAQNLPWVRDARIRLKWWKHEMEISVLERAPFAWVKIDSSQIRLADREGNLFDPVLGKFYDLPVIASMKSDTLGGRARPSDWQRAARIAGMIEKTDPTLYRMISEIFAHEGKTVLFTVTGVRIFLPETVIAEKLEHLSALLQNLILSGKSASAIDLRCERVAYVH